VWLALHTPPFNMSSVRVAGPESDRVAEADRSRIGGGPRDKVGVDDALVAKAKRHRRPRGIAMFLILRHTRRSRIGGLARGAAKMLVEAESTCAAEEADAVGLWRPERPEEGSEAGGVTRRKRIAQPPEHQLAVHTSTTTRGSPHTMPRVRSAPTHPAVPRLAQPAPIGSTLARIMPHVLTPDLGLEVRRRARNHRAIHAVPSRNFPSAYMV
jgi:hypothetical protein